MRIYRIFAATLLSVGAIAAAQAGTLKPLYAFPGVNDAKHPASLMVYSGGMLYGVTGTGGAYYLGAIYSLDPSSGATKTVYSFKGGNDGANPSIGLVAGDGGLLYGLTPAGGGRGVQGTLFQFDPVMGVESVLYAFPLNAQGQSVGLTASLLFSGGLLYGTTSGDSSNGGTVFAFDPSKDVFQNEAVFDLGLPCGADPTSALLPVGNLFYGTLAAGGGANGGGIYSFDPVSRTVACVTNFTFGSLPEPVGNLAFTNGMLFGVLRSGGANGWGAVFTTDPVSGATNTIYSFGGERDGYYPPAGLTQLGKNLYGISTGYAYPAAIYAIDPATGAERTLFEFPSRAIFGDPAAGLTVVQNTLFGTTYGVTDGATFTDGTLFKLDLASKQVDLMHQFESPTSRSNSALRALGRILYGTSSDGGSADQGAIVSLNSKTGTAQTLASFSGGADGAVPLADLVPFGSALYGTTSAGGSANLGTLFQFNPKTAAKQTAYSFTGAADGMMPNGALLPYKGELYGTTPFGGAWMGNGAVFSFDPNTAELTTLYDFNDDPWPDDLGNSSALAVSGTKLFGSRAGYDGAGAVYSASRNSGGTLLHRFNGSPDAGRPTSKLIDVSGLLYGTSSVGGSFKDAGTIYTLNATTGAFAIVYTFTGGADGTSPTGALLNVGGVLYGTTIAGGTANAGTLFVYDPVAGQKTTLYNFTGGGDGRAPDATLITLGNVLYGTTDYGGAQNRGTIFSFTP